jgi:hypothetical protein
MGGRARDATRSDEAISEVNTVEADGLKGATSSSPPPRDRITEYENALADSPRKSSAGGPLFEIIKSNKKPGDKSSPIAKLPNGAFLSFMTIQGTLVREELYVDSPQRS